MTAPKPGTFSKGDARINRKGRPKTFDELRALAQVIAHERTNVTAQDGHALTVAEAILRQWAQSKKESLQIRFMEVAFGKVPDKLEMSGPDGDAIRIIDETEKHD
jgi:predicted outer membrane protein